MFPQRIAFHLLEHIIEFIIIIEIRQPQCFVLSKKVKLIK